MYHSVNMSYQSAGMAGLMVEPQQVQVVPQQVKPMMPTLVWKECSCAPCPHFQAHAHAHSHQHQHAHKPCVNQSASGQCTSGPGQCNFMAQSQLIPPENQQNQAQKMGAQPQSFFGGPCSVDH